MNERANAFFAEKEKTIGVKLNDVQQEAVVNVTGPLLLLASPGSGKTTTIIMRIGYMMEVLGIHPARIKAVTFSKASAADMQERFAKFFPHLPSVSFSTIHSLAYEIVRRKLEADRVRYVILEEQEGAQFSKKRIFRELYERHNQTKITEDQLDELITYSSYVKNKMLPRKAWNLPQVKVPKKVEILESYEAYKQHGTEHLLIDFDDMLVMANDILENYPLILAHYQERFDYILTDESQDTSAVQHAIIEKLVEKHRNVCVVADEDQSIYSWRGADPDYLLRFNQVYEDAKLLMMTQNYRSTKMIVNAANQFIKRNKKRYDKNMFAENVEGEPIQFKELQNYHMQAEYLVQSVKKLDEKATVAILYRNHTSAIPLMDAFERAGIPFYMKDSAIRFFNHWVVEDILNFMRFAYNTKNVSVYEKIYRKMNGYVTVKQMQQLMQVDGDACVFTKLVDSVKLNDYQPDYIKRNKKIFSSIPFEKTSPTEMLLIIREKLGYEKALKKMSESLGFNYEGLIDILDVLGLIARHTDTMTEFANRLKELDRIARSSSKQRTGMVVFSTLHSAKGLEFEHVFLIDLIEGVLPSVEASKVEEDPSLIDEMEEEVRLFYVGVTRAISHLHLLTYTKRFKLSVKKSSLMEALHRIVEPERKNEKTTKSNVKATSKTVKQYRNAQTILQGAELQVGQRVKHVMFGEGEIVTLKQGIVELQFSSSVERKKFVVDTCIEQGYLEKINLKNA